jgi:hypothetical protein
MNMFQYRRKIQNANLGTITVMNFDSTLLIPFWDLFLNGPAPATNPMDLLLDSSKLSDLRIQATFNTGPTAIVNDGTNATYTQAPTLAITSREAFGYVGNFSVGRQFQLKAPAAVGATTEYIFPPLPLSFIYKGFWINTKDAQGADLAGCIDRVKLMSGTNVFMDVDFETIRNWNAMRTFYNWTENDLAGTYPAKTGVLSAGSQGGAWTYINLCDDGYLTEAIDTYSLSELILKFQVNQTITTLTVIPDVVIPVR